MALKIRLSRQGAKHRPEYLIVAMDSESKREGQYIEKIGYYYPKAKTAVEKVKINLELTKSWLARGAQPTQTVGQLIKIASKSA